MALGVILSDPVIKVLRVRFKMVPFQMWEFSINVRCRFMPQRQGTEVKRIYFFSRQKIINSSSFYQITVYGGIWGTFVIQALLLFLIKGYLK